MYRQAKKAAFGSAAVCERLLRSISSSNPAVDPASLAQIRDFILPIFDTALGTAVHETPIVEALRTRIPEANLIAAAGGIGLQVFEKHPGLSRVEALPDPNRDFLAAVQGLRPIVRSFGGRPWCALMSTGNARSRVALATMLSGNGVRAGFCVAPELMHLPLEYEQSASQISNNLRLPALLGHQVPQTLEPRVYIGPEDLERALALLSLPENLSYAPVAVLVTQTSPGQLKKWRAERFIQTANWLVRAHGCRIVLVGSPAEAGAVEELRDQIGGSCQSVAGQTSIPVLAAVLALADVALTLDTGILHVARAVALPSCIIAPAWSPTVEWLPLQNPRYVILKNLDLPAMLADYVIDEVSADEVRDALDRLLRNYPPSAAARESRIDRSLAGGRIRRAESLV